MPGQTRTAYPILGDPNDPSSSGLFDRITGAILMVASPNPIQLCEGESVGQTTIFWDVRGVAERVEVRIDSPDGTLFTDGEATGSEETGEWVTVGMVFYLVDQETGEVLDTVTITSSEAGCPAPNLVASPNPIIVCDGSGVGATSLIWDTTEVAEAIEIRVGSPDGTLLTEAEATGLKSTGRWVTDGLSFFLLDQSNSEVLDSVVVNLTEEGCPLTDFDDGYVKISSQGFVAFESFADSERLAVLAAQPLGAEDTEFTIPHYVVFGGANTMLKLVYPSSKNPGGALEVNEEGEAVEPEEKEPIQISALLRSNTGTAIGQPLMVTLEDGESLRGSVVDLFQLPTSGVIQSGWIDITTDEPGLVASAEIQAFDGKALSAVPLKAASDADVVFPHVAQALGYSTGLAVVNSGDQAAQVRLELRKSDSQLIGTRNVTLNPGHRLIGTIPELFPNSGKLFGGTVKVLSDQPLTSLELFYTDDLRILSTVPSHEIE
jgi:hypothetical protein